MTTLDAPTETLDVTGYATTLRRQGEGPPLLFLHDAFFATRWLSFHDRLAAGGVDLLAPVHPGYVEGAAPVWLQGFDDLVLHYRDLLDALDLGRVDVVGLGLGGWIGAELAIHHPHRVRTLSLLAPMGLRTADAPMLDFLATDPAVVVESLFNGPPGPEAAALLPDLRDPVAFSDDYGENGVTARLIWGRRYDLKLDRRLPRLRTPTLVVAPEEDRIVPVSHARRWTELLPTARLETIPGTGHALVVQAPDAVAATVLTFVREAQP